MPDKTDIKVGKGIGYIGTLNGDVYIDSKDNSKTKLKPITFKNLNRQYTTPLTCSGLTEKDILVCPSNENYIKEAIKNLELAHKCIIKGSSGSGKSILTYQIAKRFHDKNWNVYKYNNYESDSYQFENLDENILIVVDDAQTLSMSSFKKLIDEAHEKLFILMNWNIDSSDNSEFLRSYPSVELIATEQVELIKRYSLEHKYEITQILKKLDVKTDETDYWDNIERRIDRASEEKTAWLFNYSLTEGWRKANNDMRQLSENNELDLVLIVVAIFQILTLDEGVERKVLINEFEKYNSDKKWLEKANQVLNEYCIIDNYNIVHKHYMYAKEVLHIFESYDNKNNKYSFIIELLKRLLSSKKYEKGHSSLLEYIMFNCQYCEYILNKEKFTIDMAINLFTSKAEDEVKIKNLNSLVRINHDVISIINDNIETLNQWVLSVNSNTVLPLNSLINELYNNKMKSFIITDKMLQYVLSKIAQPNIIESARFSYLYNRLYSFATSKQRKECSNDINKTIKKLKLINNNLKIEAYHFSKIVTNLGIINEQWATKIISDNIILIANAFNKDILRAYNLYEEILYLYFGVAGIILSSGKKRNTILAKRLIKQIDSQKIIDTFNTIKRFDVQDFATFLLFISIYDRKKIEEIVCKIDFSNLKKIYKNDKELEHYHKSLIRILYNKQCEEYQKYVDYLIEKTEYLEKLLVVLNLKLALEKLENGKIFKMYFHGSEGYKFILEFLEALEEENKFELVSKIIQDNKSIIEDAIFNNISNADKSINKYNFLIYLFNKKPNLLKELFDNEEKVNKHIKKIYTLLRGKAIEKKIGKLYLFFIKEFSSKHQEDIKKLELKFPSTKKFKL
ncbi:nSTAND3 domain-containing NTPase [Methanocaldococcus sp.]